MGSHVLELAIYHELCLYCILSIFNSMEFYFNLLKMLFLKIQSSYKQFESIKSYKNIWLNFKKTLLLNIVTNLGFVSIVLLASLSPQ